MNQSLTPEFVKRAAKPLVDMATKGVERLRGVGDRGGLLLKVFMGAFALGLAILLAGTILDYRETSARASLGGSSADLPELRSVVPIVSQGFGVFLALLAFATSLSIRARHRFERRRAFFVLALGLAALAGLAAWLPTDIIETRAAIMGRAPAGESPSIPAYLGKLLLTSSLILSIPVAALAYFRLGLMDRYVVHNFLSPFLMCLSSFMAIWVIADVTDNGDYFPTLSLGQIVAFYVVQVPFVILFVLPIAILLSGLYAFSRMSKSNEFISMVGSGRSVVRILLPVIVTSGYVSLIGLALKYEWAPSSIGYKDAIIQTARREIWKRHSGGGKTAFLPEIWSKRGWMHVNEADRRTWFVGRVPLKLSDEMADVVVYQLDENDQTTMMWVAKRAKWVWDAKPPKWILTDVRIYRYDANRIPSVETKARLEVEDWADTPWKVLSSSQDPEHLGVPGLTMYLNTNHDQDDRSLAPFRTNWWYIFAEPAACLAMILVAAPLGIVYSRRGVMGGVTGAIVIFAMMYILRGTFLAMGHSNRISPFVAAWITNFVVASIGLALLWFRAQNRDISSLKTLAGGLLRRQRAG